MVHRSSYSTKHTSLEDFRGVMLQDDLWKTSDEWGGLFCANVYSKRGSFAPCNCWCGSCYEPSDFIDFPSQTPVDDYGVDQQLVGDELRFLEERNRDNLITPFHCDSCHSRHILGRGPVRTSFEDSEIMALIRIASLDSLWARELNTGPSRSSLDGEVFDSGETPIHYAPDGTFPSTGCFCWYVASQPLHCWIILSTKGFIGTMRSGELFGRQYRWSLI